MPDTTKVYEGIMGRFLEQINRPCPACALMDVIAEHGGQVSLRQLIRESDFFVAEIMEAIDSLKRRGLIRIERIGHDEIVNILELGSASSQPMKRFTKSDHV